MANVAMKIENRDENKNPRQLRAAGFLPGSLYGKGIEAKTIQLDMHDFEMQYKNNQDGTWELTLGKEKFEAKIAKKQAKLEKKETNKEQ